MKKLSLFAVAAFCLALLNFPGHAQSRGGVQKVNPISQFPAGPEAPGTLAPAAPPASLAMINEKALRNFRKAHKNSDAAFWSVIEDGFTASFEESGKKSTVYYDRKGNWVGSVRHLKEKDIPKEVWTIFKSTYYDFNINFAREIRLRDQLVYIAYMENDEAFKNARLADGVLDVLEEFKKH